MLTNILGGMLYGRETIFCDTQSDSAWNTVSIRSIFQGDTPLWHQVI